VPPGVWKLLHLGVVRRPPLVIDPPALPDVLLDPAADERRDVEVVLLEHHHVFVAVDPDLPEVHVGVRYSRLREVLGFALLHARREGRFSNATASTCEDLGARASNPC
jgi:hypothetical protein